MAVLVMGSDSDLIDAVSMEEKLVGFKVPVTRRILSAHRNTSDVLRMIEDYDGKHLPLVYLACAGKKPDLGPVIAGNTDDPVVAYVKSTEPGAFYMHHLLSSMDAPPGISYAVFSDPTNAALYAAKMIGLHVPEVREAVNAYRVDRAGKNLAADKKYGLMGLAQIKEQTKK